MPFRTRLPSVTTPVRIPTVPDSDTPRSNETSVCQQAEPKTSENSTKESDK